MFYCYFAFLLAYFFTVLCWFSIVIFSVFPLFFNGFIVVCICLNFHWFVVCFVVFCCFCLIVLHFVLISFMFLCLDFDFLSSYMACMLAWLHFILVWNFLLCYCPAKDVFLVTSCFWQTFQILKAVDLAGEIFLYQKTRLPKTVVWSEHTRTSENKILCNVC